MRVACGARLLIALCVCAAGRAAVAQESSAHRLCRVISGAPHCEVNFFPSTSSVGVAISMILTVRDDIVLFSHS
jgi:hypothetical protein